MSERLGILVPLYTLITINLKTNIKIPSGLLKLLKTLLSYLSLQARLNAFTYFFLRLLVLY